MVSCQGFLLMTVSVFTFTLCTGEVKNPDKGILAQVARGEIQSCEGCQLNRLPDVKSFIFNDVPTYNNIIFKSIPGAPPQFVLFDKSNKELTRIDLAPLNRKECNDLVEQWGFKIESDDEYDEDSSEESDHEEL